MFTPCVVPMRSRQMMVTSRCRVTYTRQSDGGFEQFFAWTQPVFTDGRLKRLP